MKVPVPWLREVAGLPEDITTVELADRLTEFDLKLEEILSPGVSGPLVVGRVLTVNPEPQKNGKTINWCRVDVGPEHNDPAEGEVPAGRGIVCGAHNFGVGDLVVVSLPGTWLPELGFEITARKTYGHVSDGMICSEAELGIGEGDHGGIIVLPAESAEPGDNAIELLGLDEEILDLEINPDRAYALSLRGVGRDTALAFGLPFNDPADRQVPADGQAHPVKIDDPACAVFVTREVSGIDPQASTPEFIVRRLEQAGMRSIALAVDISNYVMIELGQPTHAYDAQKLSGPIVVRRAEAGERLITLDDTDRELTTDDLLIADDSGPIGLAGIMGGESTEVSAETSHVVIEAAHFDPVTIARGARRHKLVSEASKRFERGVDPLLPQRAAQRVAELLVEHGGGTILPGLTVAGQAPHSDSVTMPLSLPSRVLGLDIDAETVVAALEGNGCVVSVDDGAATVTATPPSWRFDLNDPHDLVEEVLRVVGYDKVPSVVPSAPGGRGLTRTQELRRRAGISLAASGLTEVTCLPFVGSSDFDEIGIPADDPRCEFVTLANPLSNEQPGLTTTLLIGLLRSAVLNLSRGHENFGLYEVARVFRPGPGQDAPIYGVDRRPTPEEYAVFDQVLPEQPHHAAWVLVGKRVRADWRGPGIETDWADAVSVVRDLAAVLNVDLAVEQANIAPFHPGRCAAIRVDGEVVGHAGELHPKVAQEMGFGGRVAIAEVDLSALLAAAPAIGPKPEFSTFPVAKEDFAFIVADDMPSVRIAEAMQKASDLVESVRLFDVYTGDQVTAGHKSLAFNVRLRAADRTLSEADIRSARESVLAAVDALGGTLRSGS